MKRDFIKIPDNAHKILWQHEDVVSRYEKEAFSIEMFQNIQDYKITSPIEQVVWSALHCVFKICGFPEEDAHRAYQIIPQYEVGKYRVDFLVQYFEYSKEDNGLKLSKQVIIECDSQEFHERTEPERRYEKARDRFLQRSGYKVFRFTGAEILKDSLLVASEVVSFFMDGETTEDIYGCALNFGG